MNLTADTLLDGRIKIAQDRRGYRFSIDALLLGHQVTPRRGDRRVVDFGAGCGILSLLLAYRHADLQICGVEIQPALATLARDNVRANKMAHRIQIIEADLQTVNPQQLGYAADMIVSNPPFRKITSGRINPNAARALARHEIALTLEGLLRAVRRVLKTGGYFWTIYPTQRLPELIGGMQRFNIEPKFMRMVHSKANGDAKLVLMAGVKAALSGMMVGPPLVIYKDDGRYSQEVQTMLAP
jgi:tRNA1Val (adenine37-N6)-methyltransferase